MTPKKDWFLCVCCLMRKVKAMVWDTAIAYIYTHARRHPARLDETVTPPTRRARFRLSTPGSGTTRKPRHREAPRGTARMPDAVTIRRHGRPC